MKSQLHEISQKSDAESIDLWPEIYAELKETKTVKTPRLNVQFARLATILSLFFLGALVVYAVVSQIYVDSGLEGERAERLVTQVNQSITFGDMTIRLDWAYADVNRVSVGYTLLDSEGNVFVPDHADYGYNLGLYMRPVIEAEARGYRPTYTLLDSRTLYDVGSEQQVATWIPFFQYEISEYSIIENESIELDLRFNLSGVPELYRFLVEIPVYPAQFEVEEIVIPDTNVGLVLRDLTITPTLTSIFYCYTIPDEYIADENWLTGWTYWESAVSLYFDDEEVSALYPRIGMEYSTRGYSEWEFCGVLNWAIPTDVLPEEVRFVVHELREVHNGNYSQEQAEFLVEQYESHGIEVISDSYGTLGTYGVWPVGLYDGDELADLTVYNEIMTTFYDQFPEIPRIKGNWEIEFDVQQVLN